MTMNGTAFSETTCLKTIHADLKAFKYELQDLNPSLNEVINELMQALKVQNEEEKDVKKPPCSSFSCKMKQCGVILYFRLRTVTVSRMLNFLKSSKQGHSPM
ncbi:interleukin-12 subunit alpha [Ascaphus truei]|uniref:interleukin-12 subunit alpha n=1 Tax=Ascaphus truei TaxID=8439 RepID=UPI003F5AAB29